jgi:WhiB family transcriptional regulator, redox-sensing transcriptional regulator
MVANPYTATPGRVDLSWWTEAACRVEQSETFFPEQRGRHPITPQSVLRAKAICARCSVREACLETALQQREPVGIWGGLTPRERQHHLEQRQAVTA